MRYKNMEIEELVEIIKPQYKSISKIALALDLTRIQLDYAMKKNKMEYLAHMRLIRLVIKLNKENGGI